MKKTEKKYSKKDTTSEKNIYTNKKNKQTNKHT